MRRKKTNRQMEIRKLIDKLVKQEFDNWLMGIRFYGPYEEEDIDFDLLLKEEPPDLADRSYRIYEKLRQAGFYAIFGHDTWDELEEDEKENWQSLWTSVK